MTIAADRPTTPSGTPPAGGSGAGPAPAASTAGPVPRDCPTAGPLAEGATVRFADTVALAKGEVFRTCQSLADAERLLRSGGHLAEATALWEVFELLERRLCVP